MDILSRSAHSPELSAVNTSGHVLRTYAHEAVAALSVGIRFGVLIERIAAYLVGEIHPGQTIDTLPVSAREWAYLRAATILAIVDTIDGSAPPTAAEIQRHEQRTQLRVAKSRVKASAGALGHLLNAWQTDPNRPAFDLTTCRRCGAGVSIHRDTAASSPSDPIEHPCTRRDGYPPDWPKCVTCGSPALDGHLTCGRVECDEGGARRERAS